jgi:hypothetical protein
MPIPIPWADLQPELNLILLLEAATITDEMLLWVLVLELLAVLPMIPPSMAIGRLIQAWLEFHLQIKILLRPTSTHLSQQPHPRRLRRLISIAASLAQARRQAALHPHLMQVIKAMHPVKDIRLPRQVIQPTLAIIMGVMRQLLEVVLPPLEPLPWAHMSIKAASAPSH